MANRAASFGRFMASFKRQRSVADPVASDTWAYRDAKGRKHRTRIEIGKPQPIPGDTNGDWYCAVFVEGWTPHVIPAISVGPLDALMNAARLVQSFREHVADMNIRIQTKPSRRQT